MAACGGALLPPYEPAEEELLVHLIFRCMPIPLDVARIIMSFIADVRRPQRLTCQECKRECPRRAARCAPLRRF